MLTQLAIALAAAAAPARSPLAVPDTQPPLRPVYALTLADSSPRRRAVEYSDAYYTRLAIHRYGSYTMLPLFGAEYYLGQRLLTGTTRPDWLKPAHVGVATGIGALFALNTVTGVWNLWDSRHDPNARTLRLLHTTLMLASEAGFALGAAVASDDFREGGDGGSATLHKNIAIGSMALSTVGTAIMWFRRN